jgi:hypothetical protein
MSTMSDTTHLSETSTGETEALQSRADRLEREVDEIRQVADARVIKSELKAEALRAGMIDLDGIKLMDISTLQLSADGSVAEASLAMDKFKKQKPWLFAASFSSNPAVPPPVGPVRPKLATEMNDVEYKIARAAILKHRG